MISEEILQQRRDEIEQFLNGADCHEIRRLRKIVDTQDKIINEMRFVYDRTMNAIELAGCLYERAMCGDEEAWEQYKVLLSSLLMLGFCHEDNKAHLSMTLKEAMGR